MVITLINEGKKKWVQINMVTSDAHFETITPDDWEEVYTLANVPHGYEELAPRFRKGVVNKINKLNPIAS